MFQIWVYLKIEGTIEKSSLLPHQLIRFGAFGWGSYNCATALVAIQLINFYSPSTPSGWILDYCPEGLIDYLRILTSHFLTISANKWWSNSSEETFKLDFQPRRFSWNHGIFPVGTHLYRAIGTGPTSYGPFRDWELLPLARRWCRVFNRWTR